MRKTKIVATLGPATSSFNQIVALIRAGVSVFRLNFSHGKYDFHKDCVQHIRKAREEFGVSVAILADLQGPKIRTGTLAEGPVELEEGKTLIITTEDFSGTSEKVSTSYKDLTRDIKIGDPILMDDGKIRLETESVTPTEIHARIINGGLLSDRKALNLPGTRVRLPAITEKDKQDLRFAASDLNVDYIALSFARDAHDVDLLKLALDGLGASANVIVKIEKPQAVENFDSILASLSLGDGIMIARGDLGVEVDIERVPALQKRMIKKANESGILCITATQMLESLIDDTIPSRAEASDIFNATLDGSDAVMLSGETAVGHHPIKAVEYMVKIINQAEQFEGAGSRASMKSTFSDSSFGLATVKAACTAASVASAKGLVALTASGRTALLMSKLSLPDNIPFYAMTPQHSTFNALALYYGVNAILLPQAHELGDSLWQLIDELLIEHSSLRRGDTVVIASGYRISDGHTNVCKIVKLGHREYY